MPELGLACYQDKLFGTERVLSWLCLRRDLPRPIRYDRRTMAVKAASKGNDGVRNAMFEIEERTNDIALKRCHGGISWLDKVTCSSGSIGMSELQRMKAMYSKKHAEYQV
jgi:hypothetical protein